MLIAVRMRIVGFGACCRLVGFKACSAWMWISYKGVETCDRQVQPVDIQCAVGQGIKIGHITMDCVEDAKYMHGNTIDGNKFQYKYHDVSNVSIVHYANLMPK